MHRAAISAVVLVGVTFASIGLAWAQPQDPGFTATGYGGGGFGGITDIAWASDGTNNYLFITVQPGKIRVIRNGTPQAADVYTFSPALPAGSFNEMGLLGLAIDPAFASNRRIYVFASETATIQRIYRFTTTDTGGTVGISGSRTQMGVDMPANNANHVGGGLAFGPDGNLYFGVGNNGNTTNRGGNGTIDEFTSLGSKVGRMSVTGAALTSNPYYTADGSDTAVDYIFSRGWRNPFGICFQPGTSDPWVLEVGDGWEHIFLAGSGTNRGWSTENNTSTTNGKLIPRFAYQRNNGTSWAAGGGCITKGCFYTGTTFPAAYQGNLFFTEYNGGNLVRVIPNGTGTIPSANVSLFVDGSTAIVDVETGPDGALYYAHHTGWIARLQYTATTPQNIILSASTLSVNEGSTNTFTAKLAAAPASNVTVTVAWSSGDADVTVQSGASLTFTSTDWNTPQTVTIAAAHDPDSTNDGAAITASSPGLTSQNVAVTVIDDDPVNGAPTATITQPLSGAVVSGSTAEFYGDGTDPQGVGTILRAEFRIDGSLVSTDNSAGGHYHINGGHSLWDTTTLSDGIHTLQMTVFDDGGLSGSHQITVTVNNSGASVVYQQDPAAMGTVSIEAEGFDAKTDRGDAWTPVTTPAGFSGTGALQALVNDGTYMSPAANYAANSPQLEYRVNFLRPGTYVVWILGNGPTGADDSLHVGLDGAAVVSAEAMDVAEGAGYVWSNQTMVPAVATITVATAGVHILNVWMREDGFILDKIVLTLDTGFTPAGMGPTASARVPDSDFDGIPDSAEIAYGLDPLVADQDGDGIPDGQNDWDFNGTSNALDAALGNNPGTPGAPPPGGGGGGSSGGGGCGLTGLEGFALLALLALKPRRNRSV